MKKNSDYMLREIAGEVILVPTGAETANINGLITLNEVAAFIWKHMDECETPQQMLKLVLDEYEIDEETARQDVFGFLDALSQYGIILP